MAIAQPPRRQINISVSEKVYGKLQENAAKAGSSVTTYAGHLFDAAYAARMKGTPDADLDAQVALVGLATLSEAELEPIAEAAGIDVAVALRMRDGWRTVLDERRRGA